MGFGSKWRSWIKSCISSPKLAVLVKGSPTSQFGIERGLRQEDPLSPFLFNIVTEALSRIFQKAHDIGLVEGASIGTDSIHVSHLQFADDTILFLNLIRRGKRQGGLGIGKMQEKNKSLLTKWIWRFGKEENALWRRVICSKYGVAKSLLLWNWNSGKPESCFIKAVGSLFMYGSNTAKIINVGLAASVGNGKRTRFWQDPFVVDTPLRLASPRLYALAVNKEGTVDQHGRWCNLKWNWEVRLRRPLFGWEKTQWDSLTLILECVNLQENISDTVDWVLSTDGFFSVSSFRRVLDDFYTEMNPDHVLVWQVWESRNQLIFKGKQASILWATKMVGFKVVWWFKYFEKNSEDSITHMLINIPDSVHFSSKSSRIFPKQIGYPILSTGLNFNVDGSSKGNPGSAGIGGVLRGDSGKVAGMFSCYIGFTDAMLAEITAILKAAQLCYLTLELRRNSILIVSDSKWWFLGLMEMVKLLLSSRIS
ncbi:hypothetical protein Dsin_021023 [Dipteronia sinensis]|uniref:RNase H type-1 domain-containing protein n=1 Tax=Dipteronia sinensis TaxID=43782 RepID=A0AAE0AAV2_9ROSI|nr:hypothetical protein Dsin_021023 [Dipteronia sinensis]